MYFRQSRTSGDHQLEIFSDLLGQGEMDDVFQLHMTTQPVYNLNDSDIIVQTQECPVALSVTSSHIIVTTENSSYYTLYMYKKHCNIDDKERIAILSKSYCHRNNDSLFRSVLVQIITSDYIDSSDSSFSDVLKVGVTLFKHLFGEETALLNSPTLLFSQTDGTVCYIPLSSFVSSSDHSFVSTSTSDTHGWKILCHMSDCVVGIGCLTLQKDGAPSEECGTNALCICGYDGQVVVFQSKGGKPECSVSKVSIYSPVLSVKLFHNKLFYTDGSSIFESTVEVPETDNKEQSVINRRLQISDTNIVSDSNVAVIHAISSDDYYVASQGNANISFRKSFF